jgi:glycosyltransferase involved in cell wall biosynthesis
MYASLIIPTQNRAAMLARTLESVANVVNPLESVEMIVVDNGSTDGTADVCKAIGARFPRHRWRYVYEGMPGLLSGRHRGAREARGDILCYLDDDVLLAPGWLDGIREAFRDSNVALVGGPSRPKFETPPPPWLDELWWRFEGGRSFGTLSLIDLGAERQPVDPCRVWGLNFSIRRRVFQDCGGFHPDTFPNALQRYQGDGDTGLSLKIKASGHLALYHPAVAVSHVIPGSRITPESLERRAYFQGVCDSFTRIRREGVVPPARGRSWIDPVRPLKRRLHRAALLRRNDARAIRELMARAHAGGVVFHQNEVRKDPALLAWVLKSDYLDYTLPAGWEQYVDAPRA